MDPFISKASPSLEIDVRVVEDGNGTVILEVIPPASGVRPALDICLVIDTSGSMDEAANANGTEVERLFTKMDLAKRGAEVVARALGPNDTCTILGFESRVHCCLPRTWMDANGVDRSLEAIRALRPYGGTALWDGLLAGLKQLEGTSAKDRADSAPRHSVLLLLTDGEPSPSPPAGEVEELRRYIAGRDAEQPCKLITLGFGYSMNSRLLVDLADMHGGGCGNDFHFIPDGTMLLTTFVNLMANLQSTCARDVVLHIGSGGPSTHGGSSSTPPSASSVIEAMDNLFTTNAKATDQATSSPTNAPEPLKIPALISFAGEAVWKPAVPPSGGVSVHLGDVQYGQSRTVVLRERQPGATIPWRSWTLDLSYTSVVHGLEASQVSAAKPRKPQVVLDKAGAARELHRALAVSAIHNAARIAPIDGPGAQKIVKDTVLATMAASSDPALGGPFEPHAVLEDLLGQVSQAISTPESLQRWGTHYLRSLFGAHKAQACNNFKDPGVLAYGSPFSRLRREALNAICDGLPVPVPSLRGGMAYGQPCGVSSLIFRDIFNNAHGGCFASGTLIVMADGTSLPIDRLKKGDRVLVPGSSDSSESSAEVVCMVTYSGVATVRLPHSGLRITPWHPIRVNGKWLFPADVVAEQLFADTTREGSEDLSTPQESNMPLIMQQQHQFLTEFPSGGVFNLVLDRGHIVVVDGVEAVTLGHGFVHDAVVAHPYFGTEAVLRDLQAAPGWDHGRVDLGASGVRIDEDTGLVSGFAAVKEIIMV